MLALTLCAMIGLPSALPSTLSASVATKSAEGIAAASVHQDAPQERWLEVIEVYTLPFDPAWQETALGARKLGLEACFPIESEKLAERRKATEERAAKRDDAERIRKQGSEERARKTSALFEDLAASADKAMPLQIMRAWDGIAKTEVVLTFGKGQRAIVDRFKAGKPLMARVVPAAPGEDFQAVRATIRSIASSAKAPSDFAAVGDAAQELQTLAFGEVDTSTLPKPVVIPATKDPAPGSGVFSLALPLPPSAVPIDRRFPWYAEFKLFELSKDGKRVREQSFAGANLVAFALGMRQYSGSPSIATGRVEVKSPQPWGYEAEIVRWFGVAPKSKLKSATAGTAGPSGSAAPPSTPQPDASVPPVLPPEPNTPEVPDGTFLASPRRAPTSSDRPREYGFGRMCRLMRRSTKAQFIHRLPVRPSKRF